ncbi:hypothetical protein [Capnocytophaga bilenii]
MNFELCEPHGLLHAPHFGKLSEFDKVLPRWRELVARAYHYPSLILRLSFPAGASL